MPPKNRVARQATVVEVERIGPQMARLTFERPDPVGAPLPHTDHYVKILFAYRRRVLVAVRRG